MTIRTSLSAMESAGRRLTLDWARRILEPGCEPGLCRVLDVGCGSGRLLRTMVEEYRGLDAVGVDPYGMSRRDGGVRFERLGTEGLPDMLERFDLTISSMSLHHFPDKESFFSAAQFVARWQTGRLLIVDWKKGVETGIPEDYFSLNEVVESLSVSGWVVLGAQEDRWHFSIMARPERFRMAVAVVDGDMVARGMLGTASRFAMYDWTEQGLVRVEDRANPYQETRQHLKTLDVARLLSDASLLVASRIGPKGRKRLADRGIRMFLTGRPVPVAHVVDIVGQVLIPHAKAGTDGRESHVTDPPIVVDPSSFPEGWVFE